MLKTGYLWIVVQFIIYVIAVKRYLVWQHTLVSPSAFSRRAVVSYWQKYVHEVLVNRLGGLSLPRKSMVRLTDRPDMTLDVYRGRKTTMQCNIAVKRPFYLVNEQHPGTRFFDSLEFSCTSRL